MVMGFRKTSAAHARQIVASLFNGRRCDTSAPLEVARDQTCFSLSMVRFVDALYPVVYSDKIKIGQREKTEGGSRPTGSPDNYLDGMSTHDGSEDWWQRWLP